MQKSKLEIIDETANFYNLNNRSSFGVTCLYKNSEGKNCGVGRCLINPEEIQRKCASLDDTSIEVLVLRGIIKDEDFKEEYRGHGVEFWSAIQNLHDYEKYWTENGLSELGKVIVENLKYEIQSIYSETLQKSEA